MELKRKKMIGWYKSKTRGSFKILSKALGIVATTYTFNILKSDWRIIFLILIYKTNKYKQ